MGAYIGYAFAIEYILYIIIYIYIEQMSYVTNILRVRLTFYKVIFTLF